MRQNWQYAGAGQTELCVGGVEVDFGDDRLAALGLLPDEGPDEVVEEERDGGDDEAVADVNNVSEKMRHRDWGENGPLLCFFQSDEFSCN